MTPSFTTRHARHSDRREESVAHEAHFSGLREESVAREAHFSGLREESVAISTTFPGEGPICLKSSHAVIASIRINCIFSKCVVI